jgi:hypothetical protein
MLVLRWNLQWSPDRSNRFWCLQNGGYVRKSLDTRVPKRLQETDKIHANERKGRNSGLEQTVGNLLANWWRRWCSIGVGLALFREKMLNLLARFTPTRRRLPAGMGIPAW